jgi:hypothetical protein
MVLNNSTFLSAIVILGQMLVWEWGDCTSATDLPIVPAPNDR